MSKEIIVIYGKDEALSYLNESTKKINAPYLSFTELYFKMKENNDGDTALDYCFDDTPSDKDFLQNEINKEKLNKLISERATKKITIDLKDIYILAEDDKKSIYFINHNNESWTKEEAIYILAAIIKSLIDAGKFKPDYDTLTYIVHDRHFGVTDRNEDEKCEEKELIDIKKNLKKYIGISEIQISQIQTFFHKSDSKTFKYLINNK